MPSTSPLRYISAPMVNQSDFPFRLLTLQHGATLAYTQMLHTDKLLSSQDYLEFHLRDLHLTRAINAACPVVVQLGGNDIESLVKSARKFDGLCEGIDLNLGCPQEHAREGHYGAYLLAKKDWPLVTSIVSSLAHALPSTPVSAKLRLCQPIDTTVELALQLQHAGASYVALHARTVSAKRRRHGTADLGVVKQLKDVLDMPVVSNGNVRCYEDLERNLDYTGADGAMVGETLLGNPCLFENVVLDPVQISLDYLTLCKEYPDMASLSTVQTHIRHFVEFQCLRCPWNLRFCTSLSNCKSIDEIEKLLRHKAQRWRGKAPIPDPADEGFSNGDDDGINSCLPEGLSENIDEDCGYSLKFMR